MRHFLTSQTAQALIAIMSLALIIGCSESSPDATPSPTSTPAPTSTAALVSPDSTATPASAPATQTPPAPTQGFPVPQKEPPAFPTLDFALNDLLLRIDAGEITEAEAAAQTPLNRDDSVALSIHTSDDPAAILDYLSENNVSPRHTGDRYIEVFLPLRLLAETAKLPGIVRIEPIVPPQSSQTPAQNVTGNGPSCPRLSALERRRVHRQGNQDRRHRLGFSGAAELLGTELPHNPEVRCYGTRSDELLSLADCDRTAHGTIVAESVIDIAPEASLYLASIRTKGDLADVVNWMIDEDVSVINISLGWTYDGPGDGTSPETYSPLNMLSKAVDNGIVWISAAGNQGLSSWFGTPTDTDADGVLELGGTEQLKLNSAGLHLVQLRWQGDWNAETKDLDLHVYDASGNAVGHGLNPQKGEPGQRPHEIARPESNNSVVQVTTTGDTLPSWIQVLAWGALMDETTQTGSISTPADSPNPGAAAVGAANWNRVHDIEGYSSKGPTPDGRKKPDLVAAACGETAHLGAGEIFCGTSQAAPHVAAMAALVRQRFPELGPEEIIQYLSEQCRKSAASPARTTTGAQDSPCYRLSRRQLPHQLPSPRRRRSRQRLRHPPQLQRLNRIETDKRWKRFTKPPTAITGPSMPTG